MLSKPQAAMVSVTAEPIAGAALAAAQQSKRSRTSKSAFSNKVCIAVHSNEAYAGSCLLSFISPEYSKLKSQVPSPSCASAGIYSRMTSVINDDQISTPIIFFYDIDDFAHELEMRVL